MAEQIDYKTYGLGVLKDKYDPRDYIYQELAGAVTYPGGFELERMPVKNQNTINSCVAHSIALIKEVQEYYETGKKMKFSVGWVYGYRLSSQYQGQGMYPKEALANLKTIGDCLHEDFPENFEYDALKSLVTERKNKCMDNAIPYKVSAYARVTTVSAVKSCIYDKKSPVMIVCDVYSSFYNTNSSGIVPLKSGALQGSHAMTIIGWTKINNVEYYVVQNSWGDQWGDNGICYIKTDSNIITDMYTVTDKENTTIKFSDVPNDMWCKESVDKCVKAGLITGYPDGTFKPSNTITRAEICTMFAKMLSK